MSVEWPMSEDIRKAPACVKKGCEALHCPHCDSHLLFRAAAYAGETYEGVECPNECELKEEG